MSDAPNGACRLRLQLAATALCLVTAVPVLAQAPAASPDAPKPAVSTAQQTAPSDPAPQQATSASAQQPPSVTEPAATPLPRVDIDVTVTAPRVEVPLRENPAATSVVTGTTLQSMPRAVAAEEALQIVPGVKVDNQADGERVHISIRGQGLLTERGVRGIKVLLDGLPLNDPSGFAPDLFDVDWATVQKIEVFRGSASALYGGGSSGGVINITTKDGGGSTATPDFSASAGSYGFWKAFSEVGGTRGRLNYRLSASGTAGDGYRTHTAFDAFNLYGKMRWQAGDHTEFTGIVAGTHYYNDNAEGLHITWLQADRRGANPDAITFNEYQRTNRFTTGLTGRTRLGGSQQLSYAVYYRRTGWQESVPSSVQHRMYDTPGGNVQYEVSTGSGAMRNHLSIGSDLDFQSIDEYRHPNLGLAEEGPELLSDQAIQQRGVGVYAIDHVQIGNRWGVMLGLRGDHIRNELTDQLKAGGVDLSGTATFSKATGRVGVSFNPKPDVGLYAAWGQGFLPPATEELANNPDSLGGFNTHLEPATSQGVEFGVRGARSGTIWDVALFRLDTDNDFGRYRVTWRPLETFYGNVGSSRRYGLETSIGYFGTPDLALQFSYTFNDFKYVDIQSLFGTFTDKVMPNAPRHQVAADVDYLLAGHWVLGCGLFGQSLSYVDQTNVASIDGFLLVNPRVGFRWTGHNYRGELSVVARNIFDTEYIAFTEPDPDGNSYQPGPTREVFVGLRIGFGR